MKHTKLVLSMAAVLLLAIITNVQASQNPTANQTKPSEAARRVLAFEMTPTPTPEIKQPVQPIVTPSATPTPPPTPVPTPTPVSVLNYGCGPADPGVVYNMLLNIGMPRLSALQQLGSWKSESHLDPCQKAGDNGIAWGLNSWHPGRRFDMPMDLAAQVSWAINVEMKRDCASCYEQLMDAVSVDEARSAIQRSTRWGDPGARWMYADQFANEF